MSGCDQQGLSETTQDGDVSTTADIVHRAALAIVASVTAQAAPQPALPSAQPTPAPMPQPNPASSPTLPPTPPTFAGQTSSPSPTQEATNAQSQSVARPQIFVPLPSQPARPFGALQTAMATTTTTKVQAELPNAEAPRGGLQKFKTALVRLWPSNVWTAQRKSQARRVGRFAVYGVAAWFAYVAVMIVAYRFVDPPASNLMIYNYLGGKTVQHTWVPLDKISPAVIKAVVVAEDAQFCRHWGIDFAAIKYAIEHARGGTPRGASTITMQTAKNMFLWQSKSYIRKVLEVPVTVMMELIWPKKRILEIYLNIAEWGPGVFGIGAAAKHHFQTTPANLNTAAAARLAASLPNPKVRRAGRPGPKTRRKANVIRGRARNAGYYTGCVLG